MANTVTIVGLQDNSTNDMPYTLEVQYAADESGLELAVEYTGYAASPQDAPQSTGTKYFTLDWAGDVTGETVTVNLRVKATPTQVLAYAERTGLAFIGGGPPAT